MKEIKVGKLIEIRGMEFKMRNIHTHLIRSIFA